MNSVIFANQGEVSDHTTDFIQHYHQVKKRPDPYALVQLNIKNFRYYNTKFGAKAGDEILQMVLGILQDAMEQEEYAQWLYADNFGILIRHGDLDELVYGRMVALLDRLYRMEDERIYRNIFYSIGIYPITDPSVPFLDALDAANLCRKETTGLFKRCHSIEVYGENFHNRYMDHMELEIATAEAYKNYEFVNFLQPKIDLKTQQIAGAEALLRWFDKSGKPVPVVDFLPILDENGYIILVDLDTFDQVLNHLQERIKQGKKVVPVSFNISKCHFSSPNVVQDYIQIFEKYDLPKELIEIEFMESIAFNDAKRLKDVVSQFKAYGFTCALDDFGNGYSSFGVLLNAPLDTIKMDRQFFLSNLNGDSELVVKTVVQLIHSLNMKVVAEGVEKETHIQWLKECGCDFVQGYYYYKPMPLAEFDQLLDQ